MGVAQISWVWLFCDDLTGVRRPAREQAFTLVRVRSAARVSALAVGAWGPGAGLGLGLSDGCCAQRSSGEMPAGTEALAATYTGLSVLSLG